MRPQRFRHNLCISVIGVTDTSIFTSEDHMTVAEMLPLAAAGWAFLVWLFGGGLGLAIVVFIVLKLLGK